MPVEFNMLTSEKTMTAPMMIGFVIMYLLMIQGVTFYLVEGKDYSFVNFPDTESIIRSVTIPVGLSLMFVAGLVTWLGWWKKVLWENLRLPRWAWLFPVMMMLSVAFVSNYERLANIEASMLVVLVFSVSLVGITEELMFRGVVLKALRDIGFSSEWKVALWAAFIFGLVHISNMFMAGLVVFFQALNAAAFGLVLYIVMRVSGSLFLPMFLHAAWDFSLFSNHLGEGTQPSEFIGAAVLIILVLTLLIFMKRRTIWPVQVQAGGKSA